MGAKERPRRTMRVSMVGRSPAWVGGILSGGGDIAAMSKAGPEIVLCCIISRLCDGVPSARGSQPARAAAKGEPGQWTRRYERSRSRLFPLPGERRRGPTGGDFRAGLTPPHCLPPTASLGAQPVAGGVEMAPDPASERSGADGRKTAPGGDS